MHLNLEDAGGASDSSFEIRFPALFSRSWEKENDVNKVKDFFVKEKGTIAVTEALCITHKVDISDESKKVFTEPFIDAVRALNEVIAKGSLRQQVAEFRRFVNEFGTHYASSTELGTKLTIERRYTLHERQGVKNKALKDCNTLAGDSYGTCFLLFQYFNC